MDGHAQLPIEQVCLNEKKCQARVAEIWGDTTGTEIFVFMPISHFLTFNFKLGYSQLGVVIVSVG